jgi:CRISPR/Cas system-associated endonuclease/helicase Cas3
MQVKEERREEIARENRFGEEKENGNEEKRAVGDSYYLGVLNLRLRIKKYSNCTSVLDVVMTVCVK